MQINSRSIWTNIIVSKGELNIIGFMPVILWTDFPLRAPFIKFINYIINLSSKNISDIQVIGGTYFKSDEFYTIYAPNSKPYIHNYNSDEEYVYEIPGRFDIKSNDWEQKISVNPSLLELNFIKISEDELSSIFSNVAIIENNQNNEQLLKTARLGIELWKYFLYLVIIFIVIEMVISNQFYRNK